MGLWGLVQIVREWKCSWSCISATKIELLKAFPKEIGGVFDSVVLVSALGFFNVGVVKEMC